jgi:serine O-acetyltransferase
MAFSKGLNKHKSSSFTSADDGLVTSVVYDLCSAATGKMARLRRKPTRHLAPSRSRVIEIVENLRMTLFPGYFGPTDLTDETLPYYMGTILDQTRNLMEDQIARGYCFECPNDKCSMLRDECINKAKNVVEKLLVRLPHIRRFLITDVQAAYEGDPAATSPDEVIFCYPGLLAITNHRIAHELYKLTVPLIPRIISEHAHSITGIDIHPGADIEDHFFMDHGTGIVIGETCKIGSHVRLFQGVTLGALKFPLDKDGKPVKGIDRHPVIEDNVVIYSGATLLGRITVGTGSVIGGNVWLTKSVPANSKITQKQATRGVPVSGKAAGP